MTALRYVCFGVMTISAWATIHWFGYAALIPLLTFWFAALVSDAIEELSR